MNKKDIKGLIPAADKIIRANRDLLFKNGTEEIIDSYNGYTAALPVSILTIGLKPAMAIYYSDNGDKRNVAYRQNVMKVIGKILEDKYGNRYQNFSDVNKFMNKIVALKNNDTLYPSMKEDIIDCAIALKLVIRTYKLTKGDE